MLERNQVTVEMWDNYEPQKINLNDTFPWIRCKFELTMHMKGINFIVEGTEYKLFEDLYVNKESIIFYHNMLSSIIVWEVNIQNWSISWNLSANIMSKIHLMNKIITKLI